MQAEQSPLDFLINQAIEKNLGHKIKKHQKEVAKIEQQRAWRDLYLPRLDVDLSASRTRSEKGPLTEEGELNGGQYEGKVNIGQVLFNGFSDSYEYSVKETNFKIAELELDKELVEMTRQVKSLWIDVQIALQEKKLRQQNLKADEEILANLENRFKRGLVERSELNLRKLEVLQTKQLLRLNQAKLEKALVDLGVLIGGEKVDIKGEFVPQLSSVQKNKLSQWKKNGYQKTLEDLKKIYLEKNIDLELADLRLKGQEFQRKKDHSSYYPKLRFDAFWTYTGVEERKPFHQDPMALTLSLNYPLFASFDRSYTDRINLEKISERKLTVSNQRLEGKKILSQNLESLFANFEIYQLLDERLSIRRQLLQVTNDKFGRGQTDIRDVLEDKAKLQSDEIAYLETVAGILKELYALESLLAQKIL